MEIRTDPSRSHAFLTPLLNIRGKCEKFHSITIGDILEGSSKTVQYISELKCDGILVASVIWNKRNRIVMFHDVDRTFDDVLAMPRLDRSKYNTVSACNEK